MRRWRALAAVALLPPAFAACDAPEPKGEGVSAGAAAKAPPLDPYLDGYRLLQPDRFPDASQVAAGCDFASSSAIAEMEAGGAIVDERSFETSVARKLECRWASDRPWIAACRFEKAGIASSGDLGSDSQRKADITLVREGDWSPAAARFAFVQAGGLVKDANPPRWIATDTCEPFVFKAGDW
jgi:hypothetical protein